MAIEIKNYRSDLGIVLKSAVLSVTEIYYYPKDRRVNFVADIFANEDSITPVEKNPVTGFLYLEPDTDTTDLEDLIETAIRTKIENVTGKTEAECVEHNEFATNWVDFWEISYQRFISDESEEDEDVDEYLEAARILLEGE